MNVELFFGDDSVVFGTSRLRELARAEVENSRLIRASGEGNMTAAQVLHIGFWPFVNEFEKIIDRRGLPRAQLKSAFGPVATRTVLRSLSKAVAEMQREEQSHAKHWAKDAEAFGVGDLTGPVAPEVQALIDSALDQDFSAYFAVLAGTEFIAEELSRFLTGCPAFLANSTRKRWLWGEVHLLPHDHGPSHLEIDLDLARALDPDHSIAKIEERIERTITQFGCAASDVFNLLFVRRAAAE